MTGLLNWFRASGKAALAYAYLNLVLWTIEVIIYLRSFQADEMVFDEESLSLTCELLMPFFVLLGLPLMLSVFLLVGVTTKHAITCKIWCCSETILMAPYLALLVFKSNHLKAEYITLFCLQTTVRFAGIYLILDFLSKQAHSSTIDKTMKAVATKNATIVFSGEESGLNIKLNNLNNPKMLNVEENDQKQKFPLPLSDLPPPLYFECVIPKE